MAIFADTVRQDTENDAAVSAPLGYVGESQHGQEHNNTDDDFHNQQHSTQAGVVKRHNSTIHGTCSMQYIYRVKTGEAGIRVCRGPAPGTLQLMIEACRMKTPPHSQEDFDRPAPQTYEENSIAGEVLEKTSRRSSESLSSTCAATTPM